MPSITQNQTQRKYEYKPEFVKEDTHEPTSGTGYKRTLEYREWRNRAAAAMFDAGYEDDAIDFLKCAEIPSELIDPHTKTLPANASTIWVCDNDPAHKAHLFYSCCDGRYCPDCAHRQVARFARRYVPAVLEAAKKKGRNRLRKIVLTTPLDLRDPDCQKKVRNYWNALGQVWKLLAARSEKWSTAGTIESFEFGPNGHKLHFHVYHYGNYLPKNEIAKAWKTVTGGDAYIVDVKSVAQSEDATDDEIANEVLETLKYSVKFWSKDEAGNVTYIEPELMPLLMTAIKGTRRVRSRGIFYNIKEPDREPLSCVMCGAPMLRVGIVFFPIWQKTGFSPQEYRSMLDGNRLDLILANKSENGSGKGNKSPPANATQRPLWTDLTEIGQPGQSQYEDNKRKAF